VRILLVNKFLFPKAGAETVFFGTRDLLRRQGHEVVEFGMKDSRNVPSEFSAFFPRHRDYGHEAGFLRRAGDAAASVYSFEARRQLRRILASVRPDIAHLHNIYHQLTLSVLDELHAAGVPTVLTLHDYKPVCPSYVIYTEGAPCRRCVRGSVVNAVKHRCIKDSRAASLVAATEAALARRRGTWELVDRFVAPSRFMASVMAEGGVGSGKVRVVPNPHWGELEPRPDQPGPDAPFLFAGRLEEVKGLRPLLAAVASADETITLRVAGEGPLAPEVQAAASSSGRVEYLGALPPERVAEEIRGAAALVLPSLWEENCPMVVLEARAQAVPVVCSDRGGLPELVTDGEDGLLHPAGDPAALLERLLSIRRDPARAHEIGVRGHERLVGDHSPDRYLSALMDVYAEVSRRSPL
jgi:glycosyltransferase involved in cell wall biosynthesis